MRQARVSVVDVCFYDAPVFGRAVLVVLLFVSLAVPSPARGQATSPDLDVELAPSPLKARRIAVLILSGPQVGLPLSDIYLAARRALEARTALRVLPLDLLGMSGREAAIRECAGNPACFARRVRAVATDVDLLLTISLDQIRDKILLALRLVDIPSEQAIGASAEEVPMGMSLVGGMERQLPRVLPGTIWDQVATVRVESEPSTAEVTVGSYTCVSPCRLKRMVPGTYSVSVQKAGYETWRGTIVVAARRSARVQAVLREEESSSGILSSPYFWGAVGLVAVGAGILTFLLVQPGDQLVNVCIAGSQDQCN